MFGECLNTFQELGAYVCWVMSGWYADMHNYRNRKYLSYVMGLQILSHWNKLKNKWGSWKSVWYCFHSLPFVGDRGREANLAIWRLVISPEIRNHLGKAHHFGELNALGLPGCSKLSLFFKVAFLGVAVKSWWIQHSSRRRRFLKASMHRLASLSIWLRPVCEEWEIHHATRGIRRTVTMHPLYELNMVLNFFVKTFEILSGLDDTDQKHWWSEFSWIINLRKQLSGEYSKCEDVEGWALFIR